MPSNGLGRNLIDHMLSLRCTTASSTRRGFLLHHENLAQDQLDNVYHHRPEGKRQRMAEERAI